MPKQIKNLEFIFFVEENLVTIQFSFLFKNKIIEWPLDSPFSWGRRQLGGCSILPMNFFFKQLTNFHWHSKINFWKFIFHYIILYFSFYFFLYMWSCKKIWLCLIFLFGYVWFFYVKFLKTLNYVNDKKGIYFFQCKLNTW
jgi:hypothetical protein